MKYTLNLLFLNLFVCCLFAFSQISDTGNYITSAVFAKSGPINFPKGPAIYNSSLLTGVHSPAKLNAPDACVGDGPVKIVVIGSSTAEGYGVEPEESFVGRYASYLENVDSGNEVINLAKGGYNTYNLLPTGTETTVEDKPDPERNITKALSYDPDAIIINLPSNDAWKGYGTDEQMANFEIMYNEAREEGVLVWITTTQPRDKGLYGSRLKIQLEVRDAIKEIYGEYALDFWTGIASSEHKIKPEYALGDDIHLNPEGHKVLFEEVVRKKVFEKTRDLKYHRFVSVKSGLYSDKSIWNLEAVPDSEATVIIRGNHIINLDKDAMVKAVKVEENGKLDLKSYQLSAICAMDVQGTLDADQATVEFTGAENATLSGYSVVKTLKINKSQGTVGLENNLTVTGALELTDGPIALNGHNLIVEDPAAVKGGSDSSYVQTTGQGDLVYKVDHNIMNEPLLFPVGDAENYTPFTFILKSAKMADASLSMSVVDSEPVEASGAANPILSRYWDLRQEGLSDYLYNVKYKYLDEDVNAVSGKGEEDLKVIKYSEKEGWMIGGQVNADNNTLFAEGIDSFSKFSGGNNIEGASPLPVELIRFQVQATEEGYATLQWVTASEKNNDYFSIERSGNAEQWASVGSVKGAGNSNNVLQYNFTDRFPLAGRSFYRLKQVDFDGQFEYSPVVAFSSGQLPPFNVMIKPNPVEVNEDWILQLVSQESGTMVSIEVRDVLGKIHAYREFYAANGHINVSDQEMLRPGLYLITVRQGTQVIQKKLLVK